MESEIRFLSTDSPNGFGGVPTGLGGGLAFFLVLVRPTGPGGILFFKY